MQLRQAVSLMGGYGITQDCPGFLPQKWMDSQLEATYEGPEAVQRRQLIVTMTSELFLAQFRKWTWDMGRIVGRAAGDRRLHAGGRDGSVELDAALPAARGRCRWRSRCTATSGREPRSPWPMRSAGCSPRTTRSWTRSNWRRAAPRMRELAGSLDGYVQFFTDLCHVQAARAAGEVARICSELVFGYNRHPSWEPDCGSCMGAGELDGLEGLIPGISVGVRLAGDVLEEDGTHLTQSRSVRAFRRTARVRRSAQQTRRLPDRLATGQRPRRLRTVTGRHPREAGLSSVGAGSRGRDERDRRGQNRRISNKEPQR